MFAMSSGIPIRGSAAIVWYCKAVEAIKSPPRERITNTYTLDKRLAIRKPYLFRVIFGRALHWIPRQYHDAKINK